MPLSTFDGEPTEALHEHYDSDDNLTGYTVVTTPGWSDADRAWALGLAEREATQCPHGHDLGDSLDQDVLWQADEIVCKACVAVANAAKEREKHPDRAGMLFVAHKKPKPKPRKRGG